MASDPGIEPGPHWWKAVLSPLRQHCSPLDMYDVHNETFDLLAQNGSILPVPTKHTIPNTDHSRRGQVGLEAKTMTVIIIITIGPSTYKHSECVRITMRPSGTKEK